MVHIRKVEIFGFKSFGFKNTIVDFQPGLVSISGPNGSGKSNILDAIIFAMGENRPKTMRVDKLRSLLHDIEGSRRGPKMARVSVHFDNSDRQIPVDFDAVEITREMDGQGENNYYLNKKKTNRSHILDILDMANAGLHQLNAVQQGTVTRISEFSPEEKREAIENLIGLSYFDEKKAESEKQLDEADRRLEIALARMDEIKKRIDELEEERNLKLRYDLLERELNRFNAISASNKLKVILSQKETKEKDFNSLNSEVNILDQERTVIRNDIQRLESEKSKFMEEVNAFNQAKATIDTELSEAMQEYEEANTGILAAKKHIEQIDLRIPEIHQDIQKIHDERHSIESAVSAIKEELEKANVEKNKINEQVKGVNSERDVVLKQQSEVLKKKSEFDSKIKDLNDKLNSSKLKLSQLQSELSDVENKIGTNSSKHNDYEQESKKLIELQNKLETISNNHHASVTEIKSRISEFNVKKEKIEKDIEDLNLMLEKSSKAGNQYDAKIRLVKGIMHEDYSTAKLKENAEELGILGLVYEVISWNKEYERAILAVSSDWIKATVVKDFATLVS
ncbi:MAG: AAA family ATPase, partial [Nitrosopumilaceae archaeon]|nr:AAA family ATPase [Nitrosopumilaceae archaeon]